MKINRLSAFLAPIILGAISSTPAYADDAWRHTGSACVIDDSSTAAARLSSARLHHAPASAGAIYARCNVTNPEDNRDNPGWDRLEVSYRDNDGRAAARGVKATLYRVSAHGGGGIWPLVTIDPNVDLGEICVPGTRDCYMSKQFNHAFDFESYAYFVEIQVTRAAASEAIDVSVSAVRLYN